MSAALAANSGSVREAPGLAPGEVDPLGAQEAPDVLVADVAEVPGEQRRGPAGEARGRRPVERGQDAPIGGLVVGPGLARARRVGEPGQPVLANRTRHLLTTPRAQPSSRAIARLAMPAAAASTIRPARPDAARGRRARPALQRGPLLRRQDDRRRLLNRHADL